MLFHGAQDNRGPRLRALMESKNIFLDGNTYMLPRYFFNMFPRWLNTNYIVGFIIGFTYTLLVGIMWGTG